MKIGVNFTFNVFLTVCVCSCVTEVTLATTNLTCYQCTRKFEEDCFPEDLKPCASKYDRCVTHITKSAQNGFMIKRECGLAPCSFSDDMVKKGLGMDCDRSKSEYFCLFCCKENGCNTGSTAHVEYPIATLTVLAYILIKCIK